MPENVSGPPALVATLIDEIVRPFSRILMRLGSSALEFQDIVRWTFVRSFNETPEFWRRGKATAQQGALKTGMSRYEVDRLQKIPTPDGAKQLNRQNRAVRVLSGWVNDTEFHVDGKASTLPVKALRGPSFNRLVLKYSADTNVHVVIDDLVKAGCVVVVDNDVRLINQVYGLNVLDREKIVWIGTMGRHLFETSDHNLTHAQPERLMQRLWRQVLIPEDHVGEALGYIRETGVEAGRKIDRYLAGLSHAKPQEDVRYREVGIVMYAYKENFNTVATKNTEDDLAPEELQ